MSGTNKVIQLIQQPIIEERLREISDSAKEKCSLALSLPCTAENYKEIKRIRSELSKDFGMLETSRKGVENAIKECIKPFLDTYKELVTKVYTETDNELKRKIDAVTDGLIEEKRRKVKAYFDEKAVAEFNGNVPDFVSAANIHVNMSTSIPKAMKEADALIAVFKRDVDFIINTGDKELYSEYSSTLDLTQAQINLSKRRAETEQAQNFIQTFSKAHQEVKEHADKIEEIALKTPIKVEATDIAACEKLETSFTVRGTIEQLRELKNYMIKKGIEII